MSALKSQNVEIVLDLEAAELSSLYRCQMHHRHAPWLTRAISRPLVQDDFSSDTVNRIAMLAVSVGADVVLSPSHFLGDLSPVDWFQVDQELCISLRIALDREGGSHIAIDFPVICTLQMLADPNFRQKLSTSLPSLPIENVWLRISGLGKELGPTKTRGFFRSITAIHNLGIPLVLDYCAGLVGESALAFGMVSGLAHSVQSQDQFNASGWHKAPDERSEDDEFGRKTYVPVPGLGRQFSKGEVELLVRSRGGRKAILNNGPTIVSSLDDLLASGRKVYADEAQRIFVGLEAVPDAHRAMHFLGDSLDSKIRVARSLSKLSLDPTVTQELGVNAASLVKRNTAYFKSLEKSREALDRHRNEIGTTSVRARPCVDRKGIKEYNTGKK